MSLVLVPYKITLLSNIIGVLCVRTKVLVPYKITLLSNQRRSIVVADFVLVPYKITLLSNRIPGLTARGRGFSTL